MGASIKPYHVRDYQGYVEMLRDKFSEEPIVTTFEGEWVNVPHSYPPLPLNIRRYVIIYIVYTYTVHMYVLSNLLS